MTNKEGFIYVSVKDKYVTEAIDTFYIPIINLRPFIPIHFVSTFTTFPLSLLPPSPAPSPLCARARAQ